MTYNSSTIILVKSYYKNKGLVYSWLRFSSRETFDFSIRPTKETTDKIMLVCLLSQKETKKPHIVTVKIGDGNTMFSK